MSESGSVQIKIGGDSADAVRAMERMAQKEEAYKKKLQELQAELNKKSSATDKATAAQARAAAETEKFRQRNAELDAKLKGVHGTMTQQQRDYAAMVKETGALHDRVAALTRENERLVGSSGRVRDSMAQTKTVGAGMFGAMTGMAKSFVGVLVGGSGILASLRLVKAEMEAIQVAEGKATAIAVDVSSARQDVIRNMPGASEADIKAVLDSGTQISMDTGVEERVVQSALASTLSATNMNKDMSIENVRLASEFLADRPEDIPVMAGALADLAKITGQDDARTNLGYLAFAGGQSRVDDPLQQARNIPRSLKALTEAGLSPQEAIALYGGASEVGADALGESSGTAAINFVKRMQEFGKENNLDTSNFSALVQQVQMDPALSQKFVEESNFDGRFDAVFKNMIGDMASDMAEAYNVRLGATPDLEQLPDVADQMLARKHIDPLYKAAQTQRKLQRIEEGGRIQDTEGAEQGAYSAERLDGILESQGVTKMDRNVAAFVRWANTLFGKSSKEAFEIALEHQGVSYQDSAEAAPDSYRGIGARKTNAEIGEGLGGVMEKVDLLGIPGVQEDVESVSKAVEQASVESEPSRSMDGQGNPLNALMPEMLQVLKSIESNTAARSSGVEAVKEKMSGMGMDLRTPVVQPGTVY